ncbi:MAG TPA: dNTP triphosphohydrolase, partial [Marinilabiliaceae bacterium]|nr:dNTP triphosphohydrolase [Marinilabiliaceae bacterium]
PFGHSGENAISHFFKAGEGKQYREKVKDQAVWNDFVDFEGNANAFRLLTHQFNGRRKGGFRMTYTTIASIVKYPYASGNEKLKKYGYFQSELNAYHHIAHALGIPEIANSPTQYARHPLVYLVEAADDICYQIMDIEDAHKLGILSFEHTKNLLLAFFADDESTLNRLNDVCLSVTDLNEQIAFLRASVIGKLVEECTDVFIRHYDEIISGTYTGSLVKQLEGSALTAMKQCEKTGFELIYKHPSVVEIEISGFKILGSLLKEFTKAVMNPTDGYSGLLLPFIPQQYKVDDSAPAALRIQTVLDFVSGMTDVYALDLFRKINGIGLADKRFN